MLQWVYASKFSCHPGISRTLSQLKRHFWWPIMDQDTKDYVKTCSICPRGMSSNNPPAGLLQLLPIPSRPWSHIALDFVSGFPQSVRNTVVLTVIDHFSKAVHLIALSKLPSSFETANLVTLRVFSLHGFQRIFFQTRDPSSLHRFGEPSVKVLGLL